MNNFENAHKTAYISEREKRWSMEDEHADKILKSFTDFILSSFSFLSEKNIKFTRFDEFWFNKFPPNENEWVKGCPDYLAEMKNREKRFIYIELKIKDDGIYRKTITGGVTKAGSKVPNYGCESFYLDVVPVYKNMRNFCEKVGLPKEKFLILFSKTTATPEDMYIISLYEIENMINNDWNGIKIGQFGESYGQKAYLIPVKAATNVRDITREYLLSLVHDQELLP